MSWLASFAAVAAVAGLYCLFFLVSGRDYTESIQLDLEIPSGMALTHANKNREKTLVMPSNPLTPVKNKYCPLFLRVIRMRTVVREK